MEPDASRPVSVTTSLIMRQGSRLRQERNVPRGGKGGQTGVSEKARSSCSGIGVAAPDSGRIRRRKRATISFGPFPPEAEGPLRAEAFTPRRRCVCLRGRYNGIARRTPGALKPAHDSFGSAWTRFRAGLTRRGANMWVRRPRRRGSAGTRARGYPRRRRQLSRGSANSVRVTRAARTDCDPTRTSLCEEARRTACGAASTRTPGRLRSLTSSS